MKLALIDSHCHLDDDRFDDDREQIMLEAYAAGIMQMIVPATTASRWSKIKRIQQQYTGIHTAYGLHPQFMQHHQPQHLDQLELWLQQESAVAVGECGLDFFHSNRDQSQQLEFFNRQLDIAINFHLPVIIHARKSLDLVLQQLRKRPVIGGVVHSFSGSLQQAQQLFDLGFKLGIAATVSFERAKKLHKVVQEIDEEALLIESDAPDQSGVLHRGSLNKPAYIQHHLKDMAALREMSPEKMSKQLNKNCIDIFALNTD